MIELKFKSIKEQLPEVNSTVVFLYNEKSSYGFAVSVKEGIFQQEWLELDGDGCPTGTSATELEGGAQHGWKLVHFVQLSEAIDQVSVDDTFHWMYAQEWFDSLEQLDVQ